eukprot:1183172-Prorocentrum_minimum.AAC.1
MGGAPSRADRGPMQSSRLRAQARSPAHDSQAITLLVNSCKTHFIDKPLGETLTASDRCTKNRLTCRATVSPPGLVSH